MSNHIKLFEAWSKEFENNSNINEGAIKVYDPGNPWKEESSMEWPGIAEHLPDYVHPKADTMKERGIIIGADFDYDEFIADSRYRSVPMGTWKDKSLPKFLDRNSRYDEMEFDFIELIPNPEKKREPWVKIADKNGIEFMIPPHAVLDILKGGSIRDEIYPGEKFLISGMKGRIADFGILNPNVASREGVRPDTKVVVVSFKPAKYVPVPGWEPTPKDIAAGTKPPMRKVEDSEEKIYTLDEWRKSNFMHLDEKQINENADECSVRIQKFLQSVELEDWGLDTLEDVVKQHKLDVIDPNTDYEDLVTDDCGCHSSEVEFVGATENGEHLLNEMPVGRNIETGESAGYHGQTEIEAFDCVENGIKVIYYLVGPSDYIHIFKAYQH